MKKVVIIAVLLIIYFSTSAQIISFVTDSEKDYSDSTRTSYLTINGYIPDDALRIIEQEVLSNPEVYHFSFYNLSNKQKCMITCNSNLSNDVIVEIINDILSTYGLLSSENDFRNTYYTLNDKTVKLRIIGISDELAKSSIVDAVLQNINVVSFEINPENIGKLVIKREVGKDEIFNLFNSLGLGVQEITN
jgi:hypothetical protein